MNIIICLDNKNGMFFFNKRQSQDKIVRESIKNLVSDKLLFMNEYSYNLYKDIDCGNIKVCSNFLDECNDNDFCLVENSLLNDYINKIETLTIYKWNRDYPATLFFDIDLNNSNWKLINSEDFKGSSHEKITKETYRRI